MIAELSEFLKAGSTELVAKDHKLYQIRIELIPFEEADEATRVTLYCELEGDIKAQCALDILGITDPEERLQKFGMCRYGGLDERPDFTDTERNPEYYECPGRGSCKVEGKLCRSVIAPCGKINSRELDYIRLAASDLCDKEIADRMGISIETAMTHRKHITHKIGCHSKNGIVRFAMERNII